MSTPIALVTNALEFAAPPAVLALRLRRRLAGGIDIAGPGGSGAAGAAATGPRMTVPAS